MVSFGNFVNREHLNYSVGMNGMSSITHF